MSKDDWGIDGFPFVEEQPPQEQETMTDKTRYCELCEAAQREIAELKASAFGNIETTRKAAKFLAALENVDAEHRRLKAERLKPIDEVLEGIRNAIDLHHKTIATMDLGTSMARKAEVDHYERLLGWVQDIRAKYENC